MKKILLILTTLSTLVGCATINHGTTVPAGALEVSIIPGGITNNVDVRYGVTDELTAGVSADSAGFDMGVAQADLFALYRFTLDGWDLVPGVGARAYLLQKEFVPSASLALSRAWGAFRPYAGVLGDTARVTPYFGLETRFDRLMIFAQVGWLDQYRALGRKSDHTDSIDLSYSRPGQQWIPAAGVSWRF